MKRGCREVSKSALIAATRWWSPRRRAIAAHRGGSVCRLASFMCELRPR